MFFIPKFRWRRYRIARCEIPFTVDDLYRLLCRYRIPPQYKNKIQRELFPCTKAISGSSKTGTAQYPRCACRRISRLCHWRGHFSYHPSGQQATDQRRRSWSKQVSSTIPAPSRAAGITFRPEEIAEKLNEKVAEGMINISMNTAPYFEDGKAEGQCHDRKRSRSTTIPSRSSSSATIPANRSSRAKRSPWAAKSNVLPSMWSFRLAHTNARLCSTTLIRSVAKSSAQPGPSSPSP